jgi:hypothetical protein
MRSRPKPGQVTSAGFEPARIAVTQRVMAATAHQHGVGGSVGQALCAGPKNRAQRRDKADPRAGEALPG